MDILGYWRTDLNNFYDWQGENGNPDQGTVNQILDFSTSNSGGTVRYTFPQIHKDATCQMDSLDMPVKNTIVGAITDIICVIDDQCPPSKIPTGLLSKEEFDALDWINNEEA